MWRLSGLMPISINESGINPLSSPFLTIRFLETGPICGRGFGMLS